VRWQNVGFQDFVGRYFQENYFEKIFLTVSANILFILLSPTLTFFKIYPVNFVSKVHFSNLKHLFESMKGV
jgi:hypothetical protein